MLVKMYRFLKFLPTFSTPIPRPPRYWIAEVDLDGYRLTAASHVTADFTAGAAAVAVGVLGFLG